MTTAANDNLELLSVKRVCAVTSLSRAGISKLRRQGRFPAAIQLTPTRIAFLRSEVDAWMQERIDARQAA
jgi:prophage regulatory protein